MNYRCPKCGKSLEKRSSICSCECKSDKMQSNVGMSTYEIIIQYTGKGPTKEEKIAALLDAVMKMLEEKQ